MKKGTVLLLILLLIAATACGTSKEVPNADPYAPIVEKYRTAIAEEWTVEQCLDHEISSFIGMSGNEPAIGFVEIDLDGDGSNELLIGTLDASGDDYNDKLIYDFYTLKDGAPVQVFLSGERDRIYSMVDGYFAHIGSSGADDSFNTKLQFHDGALEDLHHPTEPNQYLQYSMTPLAEK